MTENEINETENRLITFSSVVIFGKLICLPYQTIMIDIAIWQYNFADFTRNMLIDKKKPHKIQIFK